MGLDRASRAGPDATDASYIVVVVVLALVVALALLRGLLRGFFFDAFSSSILPRLSDETLLFSPFCCCFLLLSSLQECSTAETSTVVHVKHVKAILVGNRTREHAWHIIQPYY